MTTPSQTVLDRILRRCFEILHTEISAEMRNLASNTLNPESFINLARALGIDFSQVPGMTSDQSGLDPYAILGLPRSATDGELKRRYRDLARRLHPDTAGITGTEFLFQTIQAAYEMIKLERGIK